MLSANEDASSKRIYVLNNENDEKTLISRITKRKNMKNFINNIKWKRTIHLENANSSMTYKANKNARLVVQFFIRVSFLLIVTGL